MKNKKTSVGGRTGMTQGEHGMMSAPGSPGQDGFNITSAVTKYEDGPCTYPQIGNIADDAERIDPRGKGGSA